jgi:cyclophilin family peptidyl-prolyl cis-trans isomerase
VGQTVECYVNSAPENFRHFADVAQSHAVYSHGLGVCSMVKSWRFQGGVPTELTATGEVDCGL